jgi:putative ABC transport system substrate-binding protein
LNRRDLLIFGGTAIAWPLAARAQQKAMPVIGWLSTAAPGPYERYLAAFRQGLSETGFVEGQNLAIEYRWAEGSFDRLPAMAADLIGRKVDLIAAVGGAPSALAAKALTSTIPIVFTSGDPVGDGVVDSLARPGGNLTGISSLNVELVAKRFELLSELIPQARVIALLVNPNLIAAANEHMISGAREAAHARGVQLAIVKAGTESEIDGVFASLAQLQAGGLVIAADPFFSSRRDQLAALASRDAVPATHQLREFTVAGGLMNYGASLTAVYRQVGVYAGRILKGEKPGDLPVQRPTKFEMAINLKTAKALGLTVPQSLLARADEVIE